MNAEESSSIVLPSKSRCLRAKSIAKRIETEKNKNAPRTRKPRQKAQTMSKYRRKTANAKERDRMKQVNDAFERLREVVPTQEMISENDKSTKVSTLRCAISYINSLNQLITDSNMGLLDPKFYNFSENILNNNSSTGSSESISSNSNSSNAKLKCSSSKKNKKSGKINKNNNKSNNKNNTKKNKKKSGVNNNNNSNSHKKYKCLREVKYSNKPMATTPLLLPSNFIGLPQHQTQPLQHQQQQQQQQQQFPTKNIYKMSPSQVKSLLPIMPLQPLNIYQQHSNMNDSYSDDSNSDTSSYDCSTSSSSTSSNLMPSLDILLQPMESLDQTVSSSTSTSYYSNSLLEGNLTTSINSSNILDDIQQILRDTENFDIFV